MLLAQTFSAKQVPDQGSTKYKIGWELTKSGYHVRSPELKKGHILVVFKLFIPILVFFMHISLAFRPIWLATSICSSSLWLLDTYF